MTFTIFGKANTTNFNAHKWKSFHVEQIALPPSSSASPSRVVGTVVVVDIFVVLVFMAVQWTKNLKHFAPSSSLQTQIITFCITEHLIFPHCNLYYYTSAWASSEKRKTKCLQSNDDEKNGRVMSGYCQYQNVSTCHLYISYVYRLLHTHAQHTMCVLFVFDTSLSNRQINWVGASRAVKRYICFYCLPYCLQIGLSYFYCARACCLLLCTFAAVATADNNRRSSSAITFNAIFIPRLSVLAVATAATTAVELFSLFVYIFTVATSRFFNILRSHHRINQNRMRYTKDEEAKREKDSKNDNSANVNGKWSDEDDNNNEYNDWFLISGAFTLIR